MPKNAEDFLKSFNGKLSNAVCDLCLPITYLDFPELMNQPVPLSKKYREAIKSYYDKLEKTELLDNKVDAKQRDEYIDQSLSHVIQSVGEIIEKIRNKMRETSSETMESYNKKLQLEEYNSKETDSDEIRIYKKMRKLTLMVSLADDLSHLSESKTIQGISQIRDALKSLKDEMSSIGEDILGYVKKRLLEEKKSILEDPLVKEIFKQTENPITHFLEGHLLFAGAAHLLRFFRGASYVQTQPKENDRPENKM